MDEFSLKLERDCAKIIIHKVKYLINSPVNSVKQISSSHNVFAFDQI